MTVVKILAHLQFLTPTLLMLVLFRVGSLIKPSLVMGAGRLHFSPFRLA